MSGAVYDPGALNHRLRLQQKLETSDGCGGLTTAWQDVAAVWGGVIPSNPQSSAVAQQNQEIAQNQIVIRFREDVGSGWRFVLNDRQFEIKTVHDPDERRRYLVCQTQEQGR